VKAKCINVECGLKLKFMFCFYGDNSWTVAARQIKFGTIKGQRHTHKSYLIIILFDRAFKYDNSADFWRYVETVSEPLYVEFCNFVQCRIL
jgi:hypothetical protein